MKQHITNCFCRCKCKIQSIQRGQMTYPYFPQRNPIFFKQLAYSVVSRGWGKREKWLFPFSGLRFLALNTCSAQLIPKKLGQFLSSERNRAFFVVLHRILLFLLGKVGKKTLH